MEKNNNINLNPRFLSEAELSDFNVKVHAKYHDINVDASHVSFSIKKLNQEIRMQKSFIKGLIEYLISLEKQLDKLSDNEKIKLECLEIFSEIGSLVYPNTNACHSIIPKDLSKINWKKELNEINKQLGKPEEIEPLLIVFENEHYERSVCCIISLCLSETFGGIDTNAKNLVLFDAQRNAASDEEHSRPRIKAVAWLSRLTEKFRQHLEGYLKILQKINEKNINEKNINENNKKKKNMK